MLRWSSITHHSDVKDSKGTPKWAAEPSNDRVPRIKENPASTDKQTIAWQFHRMDQDHEKWGWGKVGGDGLLGLIRAHMCHLERMTWAEIQAATGGKSAGNGNNNHFVSVAQMPKEARDRLEALRLDDIDDLFSLRLEGTMRIYGIRDGRVLRLVWHDPHHGSKDGAYPVKK